MATRGRQYLIATLLAILFPADANAEDTCKTPQYAELGSRATIHCYFTESFYGVYWYNTTNTLTDEPILLLQSSHKSGKGYDSGEFDIDLNGSLIINQVMLSHDQDYTVVMLKSATDNPTFFIVRVVVTDVTDPRANCPPTQIVNANLHGNTKAVVTWTPTRCSDNSEIEHSANCTHHSGAEYDLGNEMVECNCTDMSGNIGQCSFLIMVKDVTDPRANCPPTQIVNANLHGNTKAVVTWTPTRCSDNSEIEHSANCTHHSGAEYDLGNEMVECNCTDMSGNIGQCSFLIMVKDVTDPRANCPPTQIVNANLHGNTKAVVTWTPTRCSDNSEIEHSANCTHHSGAEYDLGNEMVECNCTDMSGNIGQCSFLIMVKDVTIPRAHCPAGQTHYVSEKESPEAVVEWNQEETSCTDNSPEKINPRCSHNSGNTFPSGDTTVICYCEDMSGNIDQCSFSIVVLVVKDPKLHERFMTKNFYEMNSEENFSLTCKAEYADVGFWWKQETFRGTEFVSNSSSFQIFSVSYYHQGNYFCIAKGKARSVTSQSQVLVVKNYLQFVVKIVANTTFLDNVSTAVDKTLTYESFEVLPPETSKGEMLMYVFKKTTNETKASTVYELIKEKMNSLRGDLKTLDYEIINTAYCPGGTITTTDGDLTFPDALVGKSVHSSQISLTSRVAARATRSCDGDYINSAVWKDPVITNVTKDIEENITTSIKNLAKNLREQPVSSSNASYVADVLENVTASADIETDHMDTVAVALHLVVEAQNVSKKVTTSVLIIIDNVVKSTSSNKSEVSLQSHTSAVFLETLQQQLDNVRDSGLSFNFTTPNIAVRIEQVPKGRIVIYKLPFGVNYKVGTERNVTGTISNDKLEYASKGTTFTEDPRHFQDDRTSIQVDPDAITERARQLANDVTGPIANCPATQVVNAINDGDTKAVVVWPAPSCSDNSHNVTDIRSDCTHLPGTKFDLGKTTVQCNCTDLSGNVGQCSFNIIVRDVTSPTANCPSRQIVHANVDGNTKAVVTWIPASCADNSQWDGRLNCSHQSGAKFGLGNTTVKCTCTDREGNEGECSFHVIVKDVTSPTANCPGKQVVHANLNGNRKAVVTWNPATCSDNSRTDVRLYCTHQSGNEYGLGETIVQCSCTDLAGNTARCSLKIIVKDVTSPTVNCPPKQIVNADVNGNTAAVVTWNSASCSDNSPSDVQLTCTHQSGTKFGLGKTTVQCNCTDKSKNTGQCSFKIFVKDITGPTANCPTTQIVNANLDWNTRAIVTWNLSSCTDNSQMDLRLNCTHESGCEFGLGNTTVHCFCTDMSGNTGKCSFDIIVKDVISPIVHCPSTKIVNANQDGKTRTLIPWDILWCSDNSQTDLLLNCTHHSGAEIGLGNTTVHCYCTDMSGNTGQCSFDIIVKDVTVPTVHCPATQIVNADQDGNTRASVTWDLPSCSDNSQMDLRLNCTHHSGAKFGLGNTTVQCYCTDMSGNTDQCSFDIIVQVCPEGWQDYNQSCYKLINEKLSWDEASAYCVENSPYNYGHLATIHSGLENDFITYIVLNGQRVRTWIGANDKTEEGSFAWESFNREPFLYSNWKRGEPNNAFGIEDCVEINRGRLGKWNDCKCKKRLQFVCEVELYTLSNGESGLK